MSCWVVPAVAAEYWGVTIDAVWTRVYGRLVPHKTEDGFVFVDVDPWTPDSGGRTHHEPPPTFVSADQPQEQTFEFDLPIEPPSELGPEEVEYLASDAEPSDDEAAPADEISPEDDEDLPALDEEESATFTRLSWQEVRQRVGRTRKPPAVCR